MTIFLIRHGETAQNRQQIVQPANVPLSDMGQQQAVLLADRLASLDIGHILSSDLPRAAQTANQLARKTSAVLTLTPILRERNFGDLRGQSYSQIALDFFADDYLPPNGESWGEFNARVADAWQHVVALAAETQGSLAVVTHGLVCRAMVANHLCLPEGVSLPDKWHNTSLSEFRKSPPHHILALNNADHLAKREIRSDASAPI
ncbi:MAG: putative phosphoglycerate mutase [Paraglaciecola sp.]|jgi:probable phosphoglycerate mutase